MPGLFSPDRANVGFGVELELTGLPYTLREGQDRYEYYQDGYDALRAAMVRRGIRTETIRFDQLGGFKKYDPEGRYTRWYLTHDTSTVGRDEHNAIPIEVVSRKFKIRDKDWMKEITTCWEAFYEIFELETSNETCGSHVHIKPVAPAYTLPQLKQIAYAAIIYEKHVLEILPPARRSHEYCVPNTNMSPRLKEIFSNGRNKASYGQLRDEIDDLDSPREVYEFMQGDDEDSRRVLWNFDNIIGFSGTVEFRGVPGVHSQHETTHWILFAVGFVLLAMEEDKFGSGKPFTAARAGAQLKQRTRELWVRIRECNARQFTEKEELPEDYRNMVDDETRESRSRGRVRSTPISTARSRSRSSSSRSNHVRFVGD